MQASKQAEIPRSVHIGEDVYVHLDIQGNIRMVVKWMGDCVRVAKGYEHRIEWDWGWLRRFAPNQAIEWDEAVERGWVKG